MYCSGSGLADGVKTPSGSKLTAMIRGRRPRKHQLAERLHLRTRGHGVNHDVRHSFPGDGLANGAGQAIERRVPIG